MRPTTGTLEVLFLVDLHWTEKRPLRLPSLAGVDLVLIGGDLTNFRGAESARIIVEAIREQGPRVLAVCGNCDRPEMEAYLRAEEIDLDRRCRTVGGVAIMGISAGLPFGDLPYERTEDEFREAAAAAFGDRDTEATASILVSHQPPRDTLCDLAGGAHVGSLALRAAVLDEQPDLVLSGHIHEAIASDTLGSSHLVNPGPWFSGHEYRFSIRDGRVDALPIVSPAEPTST